MIQQLSPEALQQIRAIVHEAIDAAFRAQEPRFESIDRRFESMDRRFESMDQSNDRRFESMNQSNDRRFESMNQSIDRRFDAVDAQFALVRQEIQDSAAENRRYFGVLNEALTSKLELVIEGQNGHTQRFDRLEHDMHDGFAQMDRRLIAISAHMPRASTRPTRSRPRRKKR